jgi:hypothetical protein
MATASRDSILEDYPKYLNMYNDRIAEMIKQMVISSSPTRLSDKAVAKESDRLYQSLLESYHTRMKVYRNPGYNRSLTSSWSQAYLQDIFHSNPIAEILFYIDKLNEQYKAKLSYIEQMRQRTQEAIDGQEREEEDDLSFVGSGLREMTYDPEELIGQPWVKKFGGRRYHRRCPRCNRRSRKH